MNLGLLGLLHWQVDSLPLAPPGKPHNSWWAPFKMLKCSKAAFYLTVVKDRSSYNVHGALPSLPICPSLSSCLPSHLSGLFHTCLLGLSHTCLKAIVLARPSAWSALIQALLITGSNICISVQHCLFKKPHPPYGMQLHPSLYTSHHLPYHTETVPL